MQTETYIEKLKTRIAQDEAVIVAAEGTTRSVERAMVLDGIRLHLVRDRYRLRKAMEQAA